jgi:hypothetical protein
VHSPIWPWGSYFLIYMLVFLKFPSGRWVPWMIPLSKLLSHSGILHAMQYLQWGNWLFCLIQAYVTTLQVGVLQNVYLESTTLGIYLLIKSKRHVARFLYVLIFLIAQNVYDMKWGQENEIFFLIKFEKNMEPLFVET